VPIEHQFSFNKSSSALSPMKATRAELEERKTQEASAGVTLAPFNQLSCEERGREEGLSRDWLVNRTSQQSPIESSRAILELGKSRFEARLHADIS